jgi:penicillin-binding protein 1C
MFNFKTRIKNIIVGILITLTGIVFVLRLFLSLWPYPELSEFLQKPYSLHILDRKDILLQVIPLNNGVRREYVPLNEIPPMLLDVFIRSEDNRFYYHNGFDLLALLRALDQNIRGGEIVSGASTITMQLARIISPHDHGYAGKLQEILQALFIEARMTKDSILELWLNSIPFGHNAVGVASASKIFFGKPLEQLSPTEIILLALIPRSPSKYTPLSPNGELIQKALLLSQRIGFPVKAIELEETLEKAQKVREEFSWPFFAPHFVNYIQQMITPSEFASGSPIRTSLDLDLNTAIQAVLKSKIKSAQANRIHNASCLVLDNYTGEILAYVGSEDYFDAIYSGQIDGIHIRNQPGSTLKPYLYALALSKGFTAATILPDIPSYFGGEEVYIPLNFNERFNGSKKFQRSASGYRF